MAVDVIHGRSEGGIVDTDDITCRPVEKHGATNPFSTQYFVGILKRKQFYRLQVFERLLCCAHGPVEFSAFFFFQN